MVSVIIPNYNYAPFLEERIKSILNQTYQDFEVIILDDCSTDNSLDVINKYKDNPHISQIVVNEKNSGSPFTQWQKGIELAKGELVWIAESDDTCEPQFLEKLAAAISQREDCVVAFCKIQSFDQKGNKWISTPPNLQEGVYESRTFLSDFLSWHPTIVNASGVIFKRAAAMKMDLEYTKYKGAGDRFFWTKLAELGSIAYVDIILDYCRRHTSNITQKNFLGGINQLEDKKILDYIYRKKYINNQRYNQIRINYIKQRVLTIKDSRIRKQVLKIWEPQISNRLLILLSKSFFSFIWILKYNLRKTTK